MRSATVILVYSFCFLFLNIMSAEESSASQSDVTSQQIVSELQKAEAVYRQKIKDSSDPDAVIPAYQELAILCIQGRRSSEAESLIQNLQRQFAASPETADALYAIALHWNWNGEPQKSLDLHRYNSETFAKTKKGMWSQGAIVNYYIEQKDFGSAEKEFASMSNRFKDQPTWPQEIHQFGEKYRTTDEPARALELHRYNVEHSPVASMHTMWSQGAIVHHYIRHKEFANAEREIQVMVERFSEQPTLPQELNHIANMLKSEGQVDSGMQLHRFNATQSPSSSKYSIWSQGALIHYFIEQKDFYPAEVEYKEMLSRFADQPTLPQEIYYCALKYHSVGNVEKALELHRYNAARSPESSIHSMQSQGALVHHYIETKDFEAAKREIDFLTSRFSQHEAFPQELYQFALKYQAVEASEQALELHRRNATQSPADSMYSMWSQGALIHYFISQRDFDAAERDCDAMTSRFVDQPTLSHELQLIADKYQGAGQFKLSHNLCQLGLAMFSDIDVRLGFETILIKILLARGEDEQAASMSEKVLAACLTREQSVKTLTGLGHIYRTNKQWNQASSYFLKAMEVAQSPEEKLDACTGNAMVSVWLDDDALVQETIDRLMRDYREQDRLGYSVFIIGEEYFMRGNIAQQNRNENDAQAFFATAIEIWKNNGALPDQHHAAMATYFSGIASGYKGDSAAALGYFRAIMSDYPDYDKAWHARFMAAECAQKLASLGTITAGDAADIQASAYRQILEKNPDCPVTLIVKKKVETFFKSI